MITDRDDEDAAAVLAILLALRSPTQATAPQPSRWGRPENSATWTPGPDAWWASGLAG